MLDWLVDSFAQIMTEYPDEAFCACVPWMFRQCRNTEGGQVAHASRFIYWNSSHAELITTFHSNLYHKSAQLVHEARGERPLLHKGSYTHRDINPAFNDLADFEIETLVHGG